MNGGTLKNIRESFNLTQIQFAEKLGVHPITLSRFERNADPISRLVELAICELARRLETKTRKTPPKKK